MPRSKRPMIGPARPRKNGYAHRHRRRRRPYRFRGANSNPVTCGRKFCSRCGAWRLIIDFPAHRRHGTHVVPSNRCYACGRRELRAQREAKRGELKRRQDRRREYDRIWHEVRRREVGVPERPLTRPTVSRRDPRVPAQPVRDLIERWLDPDDFVREAANWGPNIGVGLHTRENLAYLAGLNPRTVYRIITLGQSTINLSNADAICTALDLPLSYVYMDFR